MASAEILVVEDERLVATAIKNELEHFGYRVTDMASSASEAVAKAIAKRPDLVLMDIHLQGDGDGVDAAEQIRARCGIPVIYLSAFSDSETVARAGGTAPYGYLLKPYEERELQTTIEMAFAKHRAEKELEETRQWMTAIHEGIGDAVVAINPDNQIRFMNPAAESMTNWIRTNAAGAPIDRVCRLVGPSGAIAAEDLAGQSITENRAVSLPKSAWLISGDDHEIPVEGSLTTIRDSRGQFLGSVLSLRDISQRLENEKLRRQEEQRRHRADKTEAVGRLAGGLSRSLQDLLAGILSNTSIALANSTDLASPELAENHGLLSKIELDAQRAAEMVHRLRLFATMSGRAADHLHSIDLNRAVPRFLKEIHSRLDGKITLTFRPVPQCWETVGDELLLGQSLLELAQNAQDAMPQGGQLSLTLENVTLSAENLAGHLDGRPGDFVRLRVSDTGCGMRPAIQARQFEAGFTTKTSSRAIGLGLPLVLTLVQQQHGWLECFSQANHGTQFDLYLPRSESRLAGTAAVEQTEKPPAQTSTILLADADATVREQGRQILEQQGYRVLLAEDGLQAISAYSSGLNQIDLVILDLNMSRMTAYSALERLMAIDPNVHVLFSGDFFAEDLTTSEWHTLGVITKPYRPEELTGMVGRALARHRNR